MDRKNFISGLVPLGLSVSGLAKLPVGNMHLISEEEMSAKVPPYLTKGDTIGITCPAGFISLEDIQPAVNKMKEWGYQIIVGDLVGGKNYSQGGTDEERLFEFQKMLDDKNIKAIMSARGGYGVIRIIDKLNFNEFVLHPKWIIGFSDITVLHSHINRNYNLATIHSKMCNSFPSDWKGAEQVQKDAIESIRDCLSGKKMEYTVVPNKNNKPGIAHGQLVGGNLKILETLAASSSDIGTKNKILFLEDTGEYLYSIDRMFWNLKRSGKLSRLSGLIIGGFKIKPDDPGEEFGKTLEEIVLEKVNGYNYPVCFDFPVGHQKNNVALKCGMMHKLVISENDVYLKEH